jgi:hypothetical protein
MTGPLSRGVCGQRISVVGTSGSGKTTTAAQIAKRLGIPHVKMDALHWEPNWTEVPFEVFCERLFDIGPARIRPPCCRAPVLAARDASVDRRIIIQTVPDQR